MPPGSSRPSRWTTPSSSPTARSPSARSHRTPRRCATRSPAGLPPSRPGIRSLPVQRPFLARLRRVLAPAPSRRRGPAPLAAGPQPGRPDRLQGAAADGADEPRPPGRDDRADELVDDPSTLTSLTRLGDIFDLVQDAGQKIGPYQTVCDYWNYCVTYLTEPLRAADTVRVRRARAAAGDRGHDDAERRCRATRSTTTPEARPMGASRAARWCRRLSGASSPRSTATRPRTTASRSCTATRTGRRSPTASPTARPVRPATCSARPCCPASDANNPAFGVSQVAGPGSLSGVPSLGKTDLFLTQNGDRVFWDSANNPPENP